MALSVDLGNFALLVQIAVSSSTAVLLASLGEIVAERSGVLNLGLEGMLLLGALAGFAVGAVTGDSYAALGAAALAGALAALVHGFFTISLGANQVLSGLALSLLGAGLTGVLGRDLLGAPGLVLAAVPLPRLSAIPVLGPALFNQPPLTYLALALAPLLWWGLGHTRLGLLIRACGENAAAAYASGVPVRLVRYGCTCFGGALCGLGGAFLSLSYTPGWKEGMSAGQGWIAIAMVIFALWKPLRALFGSLLFGVLIAAQFLMQTESVQWAPVWLLRAMPYLLTIAVLTLVHASPRLRRRSGPPANLGRFFRPEG
jgi:general nucleoside transport system permease protein